MSDTGIHTFAVRLFDFRMRKGVSCSTSSFINMIGDVFYEFSPSKYIMYKIGKNNIQFYSFIVNSFHTWVFLY